MHLQNFEENEIFSVVAIYEAQFTQAFSVGSRMSYQEPELHMGKSFVLIYKITRDSKSCGFL